VRVIVPHRTSRSDNGLRAESLSTVFTPILMHIHFNNSVTGSGICRQADVLFASFDYQSRHIFSASFAETLSDGGRDFEFAMNLNSGSRLECWWTPGR
jgi:hypothetical protein